MKLLAIAVVIAAILSLVNMASAGHKKILYSTLCEYSKYNTKDYMYQNDTLYCRESPNSYQKLHKVVKKKFTKKVE